MQFGEAQNKGSRKKLHTLTRALPPISTAPGRVCMSSKNKKSTRRKQVCRGARGGSRAPRGDERAPRKRQACRGKGQAWAHVWRLLRAPPTLLVSPHHHHQAGWAWLVHAHARGVFVLPLFRPTLYPDNRRPPRLAARPRQAARGGAAGQGGGAAGEARGEARGGEKGGRAAHAQGAHNQAPVKELCAGCERCPTCCAPPLCMRPSFRVP